MDLRALVIGNDGRVADRSVEQTCAGRRLDQTQLNRVPIGIKRAQRVLESWRAQHDIGERREDRRAIDAVVRRLPDDLHFSLTVAGLEADLAVAAAAQRQIAARADEVELAFSQAAMADHLPVLAKIDPERSAARDVGRLRETLAARFAWAAPAATVATLHRKSVADLVRLERRFYRRWIRGTIADFLPLGENVSTVIRVEGTGESLQVTFPLHVARRNGLEAGAEVVVSLLRDGIHLMPRD